MRTGSWRGLLAILKRCNTLLRSHRMLCVIVYHVLSTRKPYAESESSRPTSDIKQKAVQRHLRDLRKLGLEVQIEPKATDASCHGINLSFAMGHS